MLAGRICDEGDPLVTNAVVHDDDVVAVEAGTDVSDVASVHGGTELVDVLPGSCGRRAVVCVITDGLPDIVGYRAAGAGPDGDSRKGERQRHSQRGACAFGRYRHA